MDPYNAGGLESLVVLAVVAALVVLVAFAIARAADDRRDR